MEALLADRRASTSRARSSTPRSPRMQQAAVEDLKQRGMTHRRT